MKVTRAILNTIKEEGAKHIFMVPGGLIDPLCDELVHDRDIKPIIAAHEAGALYMADGYARASGNFGVGLTIGGPGLTNAITPLYTAFMDQIPLMLITGEVNTEWEARGFIQDTSVNSSVPGQMLLSRITSQSMRIGTFSNFNFNMRTLLRKMWTPASRGPVHLSVPLNIMQGDVDKFEHLTISDSLKRPKIMDYEAFQKIPEIVAGSSKVAIICGAGVSDQSTSKKLVELADKFNIGVITTLAAKGSFPENHPLSLGTFGWAGNRTAIDTILSEDLEVLIVLGSKMNMQDTLFWHERLGRLKALIQVDLNENSIGHHFPTHHPIVSDSGVFIEKLTQELDKRKDQLETSMGERRQWYDSIIGKGSKFYDEDNGILDIDPIHPARVITELREVMPKETILTVDNGAHSFFTSHYWQSYEPRTFLSALRYVGAMGWAIPAGIGAAFAKPDYKSVVVTGDGCMLMHGMEVQTAVRYNLPVVFVVMNNSAFGNPYLRAQKVGPEAAKLQKLPEHDFAGLGKSLGAVGLTVTRPDEIRGTLERAKNINKTVVVDVKCGNFPTPTKTFDATLLAKLREKA